MLSPIQSLEAIDTETADYVVITSDWVCPLCEGVAARPGAEMHSGCEFSTVYEALEDLTKMIQLHRHAEASTFSGGPDQEGVVSGLLDEMNLICNKYDIPVNKG